MAFVADASVALCWALADEQHAIAEDALARVRTDEIRVPVIWWFEVRNALIVSERRRRIAERDVAGFLRQLGTLRIVIETLPPDTDVLALSRKHRLSVYDAAYLELANRRNLCLATLDRPLADAAKKEGVTLLGA
jgi:predicted nucleic acid-binding protein